MQDKHILAIDLGTSGPKVALVTTRGEIIAHAFAPVSLHLPDDGGAEQDPQDWWQAISQAAREVMAQPAAQGVRVAAVSTTSQWSGTVCVDDKGQAIGRAIIWMDSRGREAVQKISGGLLPVAGYAAGKLWRWLRLTGGAPGQAGKDSLAHILYIREHQPERYRRTYKFLEPMDYINLRLTGRYASSSASIALHWLTDNRDLSHVYYHKSLLRMCGIDKDKLPEILPVDAILGELRPAAAEALGLKAPAQVVVGSPDMHSAMVGSGAVLDYQAHLYIGTSSWLTCHVPERKTDLLHNMACLPSALPARYFITNEQETAGASLNFLRDRVLYPQDLLDDSVAPEDIFDRLDQLAATVTAGSEGLIFTPWLYGERTPVEDHSLRGGFFNMSLDSSRAHMVRAVFEGVAYNSRWLLETVENFVDRRLDPIRFIGGGARSDLWCQTMADVFDREILQVQDPIDANARGAALLAALAIGAIDLEQLSQAVRIQKIFTPQAQNRAMFDRQYLAFKDIYRFNKGIYHRLNAGEVGIAAGEGSDDIADKNTL